jgi:hypothetical protein
MSIETVFKRMTAKGYSFSVGTMDGNFAKLILPAMHITGGTVMIPMWVKSQNEKEVVCVLGSEPTESHPEQKIPRSYFSSIVSLPKP